MRFLIVLIVTLFSFQIYAADIDWNESEISWYGYADGLRAAKEQNKNVILIVYAEWCGVCTQYSEMFKDHRVVSKADNVIFIKLDQDKETQYLNKYSIDGKYVPRTYILNKNFNILESPYRNNKYQFFLPPGNAAYLANLLDMLK